MLNLLFLFAVMLTIVTVCRHARGNRLTRSVRRDQLRTTFVRFIDANRTTSTSEVEIEQFLGETSDVEALFSRDSIPRLRLELRDQALRLSRLSAAVEEGWVGAGYQVAIVEGCQEKQAWFNRIARSLDSWFDESNGSDSGLQLICSAGIERFNRLIRA